MNEKLNQLFTAARRERPAAPAEGFAALVMNQIQRNPARPELSMSDLLGMWFPRLAAAAAAVIVLFVVGDFVSSSNAPSLSESAAQLSDQFYAEN
jgi:hypothetical protein